MYQSTFWSRQTVKRWKGNHRRKIVIGKLLFWGSMEYILHSFKMKWSYRHTRILSIWSRASWHGSILFEVGAD